MHFTRLLILFTQSRKVHAIIGGFCRGRLQGVGISWPLSVEASVSPLRLAHAAIRIGHVGLKEDACCMQVSVVGVLAWLTGLLTLASGSLSVACAPGRRLVDSCSTLAPHFREPSPRKVEGDKATY